MKTSGKYILDSDGQTPLPCDDLLTWARWFENDAGRLIALDKCENGVEVSTVFVGIDTSPSSTLPLLFETMIRGGAHDGCTRR